MFFYFLWFPFRGGVVVLCSACPRTACKFCLNCNASYCETHVRQHYRASALQEHKLVEATADLEQTCQQHYRRLEFFCKTDQTLVCALCLVREHRGHEIMELEENESLQSHKSQMASQKALPRPGPIMFTSVNPDSVSLRWGPPEGQTEPHTFRLTWKCEGDHDSVEVSGVKFKAEELIPGKKYEFTVATLMSDGSQSPSVFATTTTEIPQPDNVDVTTDLTSLSVTWSKPAGVDGVKYLLSLHSEGECLETLSLKSHKRQFPGLLMGKEYSISVSTVLKNGGQSSPVSKTSRTKVPVPEKLSIDSVTATSANLSWSLYHVMDENPHSFLISYQSGGTEPQTISSDSCSTVITGLTPGTEYTVSVFTKIKHGGQSQASTKTISTGVPVPEKLSIDSVTGTSANLSWSLSHVMDENPHSFLISYQSGGTEPQTISSDLCSTVITGLRPLTEYTVSVITKIKHGGQSQPSTKTISTGVPVPEQLSIDSVTATSANLSWSLCHVMDENPHSFLISYHSKGTEPQTISTDSCSAVITGLRPLTEYTVSVITKIKHGGQSQPSTKTIRTAVPVPEQLTVVSEKATSAELRWIPPHGMDQTPHTYQISYQGEGTGPQTISTDSCSIVITGLKPGTDYNVRVCIQLKGGRMSEPIKTVVHTVVPFPGWLTVVSVTATSAELKWSPPHGMDQTPHTYQISYQSEGTGPQTISTDSCSIVITGLKPGTDYNVSVCIQLKGGRMSEPITKVFHTEIPTKKFYTTVIGNTQGHHKPLKSLLIKNKLTEVETVEDCDNILAFCVIVSHVGTDMEAALKEVPGTKPAVLVVMHHTFDPDHVIPDTSRFVKGREITVIDILFHKDQGILRCQQNSQAVEQLQKEFRVSPISETQEPWSLLGPSKRNGPRPSPVNNNSAAADGFHSSSKSGSSEKLKYCTLVSGNTLNSHEHFKKCLADKGLLPTEVSSVEQCDIVLVFCPVVSTFTSDTEKAFRLIPHGKPAVVVVMHHTFDTDYTSPENMRKNGTLVVHCLFFEDIGLLKCSKNDAAISFVAEWLWERFPFMITKKKSDIVPQEKQRSWWLW